LELITLFIASSFAPLLPGEGLSRRRGLPKIGTSGRAIIDIQQFGMAFPHVFVPYRRTQSLQLGPQPVMVRLRLGRIRQVVLLNNWNQWIGTKCVSWIVVENDPYQKFLREMQPIAIHSIKNNINNAVRAAAALTVLPL
jgi:hypothetical protein